MSRAAIYESHGGPEVLELREVPEPHAGLGEVRVRVAAAALNPIDWGISSRPEAAARFGITVTSGFGSDFAGVVDEVGGGATGFAVGDRVYGDAMARAAAEFVVVKTLMRSGIRRRASATRWRAPFRWLGTPPPPPWRRSASGRVTPS